jgi:hypothetical protein
MYGIRTDETALDQIDALPDDALLLYAELLVVLEMVPWHGDSIVKTNPKGPLRIMAFGGVGMMTYLVWKISCESTC